jgi:hypothetical protein
MKTYIYRVRRENGNITPDHDWWETDGPHGRILSPEETQALMGYQETWTVICDEKTDEANEIDEPQVISVQVGPEGWVQEPGNELTSDCSLVAVGRAAPMGTTHVLRFIRPDGTSPSILRVRYVTGKESIGVVPMITRVAYPYTQEAVDEDHYLYGSHAECNHLTNWTFGSGALRHMERLSRVKGVKQQIPDAQWDEAENASSRANLAILRAFNVYPIRRDIWKRAALETSLRVEMQWNDTGPWLPVDSKGLPVEVQSSK